jgi:solute carrier family 25 uncoupling protein 8/9
MNVKRKEGESKALFYLKSICCASIAGCVAETFTIPLDTAKVRLQIQARAADATTAPKYKGFAGTMATIASEEGPLALFNGLSAGLQRQCLFAGLRMGLYVPVRNMISGELKPGENPTLMTKILAGVLTGAFAICVANPTDVVKIRLQAQNRSADPKMVRYTGTIDCY